MTKIKNWNSYRPILIGLTALFILVGGFGMWSVTSQISGAIVSSARFEVDRNRQIVQHQGGGTVAEILVDEGDFVHSGDLLLQLDGTQLRSRLSIVEAQLYELQARRGRFEAEQKESNTITFDPQLLKAAEQDPEIQEMISGQTSLFQTRSVAMRQEISQMTKRIEQIKSEITGIEAQQVSLGEQITFIDEELTNQQALLDKKLAQAGTVLSLKREASRLSGQLGELIASKSRAEGRITEIELEKLKLATQNREEAISNLRDLRSQELELAERRQALSQEIAELSIRAPVSGIIYGMQVRTPRSVVRPAEPVLYLVPQDRPLVIAAKVDLIHVDQLVTGQDVSLRLSALDQRTTPELYGHIVQISADAFEDETTGQSYYRTEIFLNEGEIDRLSEGTILIPGMPVEAYIKTGDRTPMAYLVKPLTDYFVRAFRET
ncbi:MAG: HlyD family type I secretion periplasmic adaptor subunit [Pseudohongiellaceae bacterium]